MATRFINPATVAKPPGYSHVVEISGPARIIYLAGQLGHDIDNRIVGAPGDFRAQAIQTFENLKNALAAVGATFKDVVKMNNYLTDISHLPIFRDVRDMYVNTAAPPASTTIQISRLAREGAVLECEAIAIVAGRAPRAKAAGRRRTSVRAKARAKSTTGRRTKKRR